MLSSAGNPYLKTHALDGMAKAGIRFTNAYATNPVCVPSRISMATGVMPGRFGVFNNGMKAKIPKMVGENSLGKLIKSGGYDTFYGGKVHMAPVLSPSGRLRRVLQGSTGRTGRDLYRIHDPPA